MPGVWTSGVPLSGVWFSGVWFSGVWTSGISTGEVFGRACRVQRVLQNYNGGHLIDHPAGRPLVPTGCAQSRVRGHSGQPLVDECHGHVELVGQPGGEPDRILGGCRLAARERDGPSDHEGYGIPLQRERSDAIDVAVPAAHRLDRDREHAIRIAASHADSHRTDIEAEPDSATH